MNISIFRHNSHNAKHSDAISMASVRAASYIFVDDDDFSWSERKKIGFLCNGNRTRAKMKSTELKTSEWKYELEIHFTFSF